MKPLRANLQLRWTAPQLTRPGDGRIGHAVGELWLMAPQPWWRIGQSSGSRHNSLAGLAYCRDLAARCQSALVSECGGTAGGGRDQLRSGCSCRTIIQKLEVLQAWRFDENHLGAYGKLTVCKNFGE